MNIFSKEPIKKIGAFAKAHKFISAIVIIALLGGGWWAYSSLTSTEGEVSYVFGAVERGTVVASISASGQVSASNQIDLTAKAAGDLVYLNAKVGQQVGAGALIAQTDSTDAAFELESARISYDELVNIDPDDLENAQTDVEGTYTDARTTLIEASTDFSDALRAIDEIHGGYLGYEMGRSKKEKDYIETAGKSFNAADDAVDAFLDTYVTLNSKSTNEDVEALVASAYDTAVVVLQAAKDTKDAVAYIRDRDDEQNMTVADEAYTSINEMITSASASVNSLSSARDAIKTDNDALKELEDGPDTLDLRSEELNLRQKKEAYNDHFIRAPFAGIIASVPVQKGDSLKSDSVVATLITKQKIAELSLNEVDAAKVEMDDKVTLTFDAVEELSLTGSVAEVDLVGTVSQGVVSYVVKIGFDSEDERIKPGMTVNASIQTDVAQDVLIVPSSAVKTQQGQTYVQVMSEDGVLTSLPVEVGVSDDINVEVISGLTEGQQIIVRTTTGASAAVTSGTTGTSAAGGRSPAGAVMRAF